MLRFILLFSSLFLPLTVSAEEKKFSFIHVNDLHSRFQGFAPTLDYTPLTTGDDKTKGGWARIATHIKQLKAQRAQPVLGLNAGDFSMGSLFHMGIRETGFELNLMKQIGVDITTLGNHEFDLGPDGLARILDAAYNNGPLPDIVFSNIVFDPHSDEDDSLQRVFEQRAIPPYVIKELNGVKVGFFGMMGNDAVEVSPFAAPVTFEDTIATSRQMVATLKGELGADVVVFISHSGVWQDKSISEDEIMAQQVDGIDIIVSGHTSKKLDKPIFVNDTWIVHAGAYGAYVGIMDMVYDAGKLTLEHYQLTSIDDTIVGDAEVQKQIDNYGQQVIEKMVLAPESLSFNQVIAQTDFALKVDHDESNIGNVVADSIRWYLTELTPDEPVQFAIESNGLVRDHILIGETGGVSVADAFSVMPLGIGKDDTMAYPLVSFYVTAAEIKDALEVTTSVVPLKGDEFFLHVSGLRYQYNPNRIFFDRVTGIQQLMPDGSYQELDYSSNNTQLYRVAANLYNATMMTLVESFTKGILTIVPKDQHGQALDNLSQALVDASKADGLQETKQWLALIRYLQHLPDTDGDTIANIPQSYSEWTPRTQVQASWNPINLLSNGATITWVTFAIVALLITLVLTLLVNVLRRQ